MPDYYGDVNKVLKKSGTMVDDLFLEPEEDETEEEALNNFVIELLEEAKEYIDWHRNKVFEEPVPGLVNSIAERIGVRMIDLVTRGQTNQIVEVGDFDMQIIEDEILTDSIRKDLNLLPKGSDKTDRAKIGMAIVGDIDEEEEDTYWGL